MSVPEPEMMGIDPERYENVDLPLFMAELDDFLPDTVYDFHVHVGQEEHHVPFSEETKRTLWPAAIPRHFPAEQLMDVQHRLFPGRKTGTLGFAMPNPENNLQALNEYVSQQAKQPGTRRSLRGQALSVA